MASGEITIKVAFKNAEAITELATAITGLAGLVPDDLKAEAERYAEMALHAVRALGIVKDGAE
jgi:hypothetical protein